MNTITYADTLVIHNDHVCLTSAYALHDQPIELRHYWSFGHQRDLNMHMLESGIGQTLQKVGDGRYRFMDRMFSRELELPMRGQTKAIDVTQTPIPCPKVRAGIETRYYNGVWQKYSKREGWIQA